MGRRRNSISRCSTGISMKRSAATEGSSRGRRATNWSQSSRERSVRNLPAGGLGICLTPQLLFNNQDLNIPIAMNHADTHVTLLPYQQQIGGSAAYLQVVNPQFTKRGRQLRTCKTDSPVDAADLQTQAGLKKKKHGSGRPRLRGTGDRIKNGTFARVGRKAAE